MLFWSTLRTIDKDLIRWALLSSIIYFVTQTLVICITLFQFGMFVDKAYAVLSHRVVFGVVSGYYYYCITEHKSPRARRSNSSQDLSSTPAK
ncbi:hypothetical protein LSH36_304g06009 [Paralvinella palmiformis]|uniref:Uncharacterized protein n=1 Tax=Paralvinella palmiformis TaxID=53620 RepID=A0AAD9N1F6_9ANNE|nr:hypothetical protein LSH36_304g06009 [Paralvinella palmiformis]